MVFLVVDFTFIVVVVVPREVVCDGQEVKPWISMNQEVTHEAQQPKSQEWHVPI
jgi:hypothetical protein